MQTRIWGLLEWLLHHWKAVKNNKIKKACVTVSLCGLQTWNIYTLVHHRKNIFALESTVSVLEGSLRTVVYHGHSAALLEVKVKVWEWQRSQGWCYRCVLWQPARAEVLTLWCAASWGPFSGFVRPKLFCDNSAAPLSSLCRYQSWYTLIVRKQWWKPQGQPRQWHHAGLLCCAFKIKMKAGFT